MPRNCAHNTPWMVFEWKLWVKMEKLNVRFNYSPTLPPASKENSPLTLGPKLSAFDMVFLGLSFHHHLFSSLISFCKLKHAWCTNPREKNGNPAANQKNMTDCNLVDSLSVAPLTLCWNAYFYHFSCTDWLFGSFAAMPYYDAAMHIISLWFIQIHPNVTWILQYPH